MRTLRFLAAVSATSALLLGGLSAPAALAATAAPSIAASCVAPTSEPPILDTGFTAAQIGSGPRVAVTMDLDQPALYQKAMDTWRQLRRQAWDRNPYFAAGSATFTTRLQDVARAKGLTSADAYANAATWDRLAERAAVQRAAEMTVTGMTHSRPSASGSLPTRSEIIASTSNIASAMQLWYSEIETLDKKGGAWAFDTGHAYELFQMTSPSGFSSSRGGAVGNTSAATTSTPTGWKGRYLIPVTITGPTANSTATSSGTVGIGTSCMHRVTATIPGTGEWNAPSSSTLPIIGSYTSSNPTVVSVDANGTLTGKTAGTATITLTSGDRTFTTLYTVKDTTPPTITVHPTSIELGIGDAAPNLLQGVTVTDNSDTGLVATASGRVDTSKPGTTTITYTAKDSSGNAATPVTRTYTVRDKRAPRITVAPSSVTMEFGATAPDLLAGVFAVDDIDGSVGVSTSSKVDTRRLGNQIVTYEATDSSGNRVTMTRTYTVVDTTKPVITATPAFVSLSVGVAAPDLREGVTVSDLADPAPTLTISGSVDTSKAGDSTVTYTARDASGNTATATRTYRLVPDRVAPTIKFEKSTVRLPLGAPQPNLWAGVSVTDDLTPSPTITTTGTIDTSTAGLYEVRYTARDAAGNSTIMVRTYVVMPLEHRVEGTNRYETSVAVSKETNAIGQPVILATGEQFADALAAGPLAAKLSGTVLLTLPDRLPDAIAAEITRLAPSQLIVLGSTNSVSDEVAAAAQTAAPRATMERVGGTDRAETAALIAERYFENSHSAFVTTGYSFPDALSAAAAASMSSTPAPVLLTTPDKLSPAAAKALKSIKAYTMTVVGGYSSVSMAVERALRADAIWVNRYGGANRYETNVQVMSAFTQEHRTRAVVVATGERAPDALVAALLVRLYQAPLLLMPATCAPQPTHEYAAALSELPRVTIGSNASINEGSVNRRCE